LSTTNPIWSDMGSNPDLRGERPATNRHGRLTLVQPKNTPPCISRTVCAM
jgi:hypothetical protein